jgi:hypothetical protein
MFCLKFVFQGLEQNVSMSFALYKVKFDGDLSVRQVSGNNDPSSDPVNDDNCTSECWNNSAWDGYSTNPATPLSSLFAEPNTVETVNDDIASKPAGLGVYLKCGAAELRFNVSAIEQRSLHLLNSVPNSLFMLMMVIIFLLYFCRFIFDISISLYNFVGG